MSSDYFVWRATSAPRCCTVTDIMNVERSFELGRGISRALGFPEDASFRMNPDYPKDVKLPAQVYNRDGLVVINAAIESVLVGKHRELVEFLPVTLINHKGRPVDKPYWIVNPLRVMDAIDKEASELMWNNIEPDKIAACIRLVLDADRIDPDYSMFRLAHMHDVVVVRQDLAAILEAGRFSGLKIEPVESFET